MPSDAPAYTDHHLNRARQFMTERRWSGHSDELAALIADIERETLRSAPGANNPPLLPEKLVDPDVIAPLLQENYPALIKRSADLIAAAERWRQGHAEPAPEGWPEGKPFPARLRILDEADNQRTSDFLRQIDAFAGGKNPASGLVNEAREKVKKPLDDAAKVAHAWFNGLRDSLREFRLAVDGVQTAYLREKAALAQQQRDEEAKQARDAAEVARLKALAEEGEERAVTEAARTAEIADRATQAAAAPRTEMARSTSTGGTTTTLRSNWTHQVTDLMALVKAVAEGKQPLIFLTANTAMINAAIKNKDTALRECPGLDIFDDARAVRTGRTS